MKSRQYCSVCKQWLDMEVVPTGDGDDDGVIWFRCPQCQGFLPKLSQPSAGTGGPAPADGPAGDDEPAAGAGAAGAGADRDERDHAADDAADTDADGDEDEDGIGDDDDERDDGDSAPAAPPAGAEPVLEYAAMLAAVDPAAAVPYRPWGTYEVGQCVLHLAWNDCGVVVAKEQLPGGRRAIKCWFQGAGVVRLIENAPR